MSDDHTFRGSRVFYGDGPAAEDEDTYYRPFELTVCETPEQIQAVLDKEFEAGASEMLKLHDAFSGRTIYLRLFSWSYFAFEQCEIGVNLKSMFSEDEFDDDEDDDDDAPPRPPGRPSGGPSGGRAKSTARATSESRSRSRNHHSPTYH